MWTCFLHTFSEHFRCRYFMIQLFINTPPFFTMCLKLLMKKSFWKLHWEIKEYSFKKEEKGIAYQPLHKRWKENVAFSISQRCGPELHRQCLSLDLNMISGSLKIKLVILVKCDSHRLLFLLMCLGGDLWKLKVFTKII